MPNELKKTNYKNLYIAENNTYYFRKSIDGKSIVKKVASNVDEQEAYNIMNSVKFKKIVYGNTVGVLFDEYTDCLKEDIEAKKKLYLSKIDKHRYHKIDSLSSEDMEKLFDKIYQRTDKKSMKKLLSTINGFYEWCVQKKYCKINIIKYIDTNKYFQTTTEDIDESKVSKLLEAINNEDDTRYRAYWLLGLEGRRKSDIAYLKYKNIDFENSKITVEPELSVSKEYEVYDISNASRNCLFELTFMKDLNSEDYVFTTSTGNPIYNIDKKWKKICLEAGVTLKFNDLKDITREY